MRPVTCCKSLLNRCLLAAGDETAMSQFNKFCYDQKIILQFFGTSQLSIDYCEVNTTTLDGVPPLIGLSDLLANEAVLTYSVHLKYEVALMLLEVSVGGTNL